MTPGARSIVRWTSLAAGACGAVLSPIPLADEALLLPTYAVLGGIIARDHGLGWRDTPWRVLGRTAVTALGARATANLAVTYVPGVSAAANAVTAVAVTVAYASLVDRACADPLQARALSLPEFVDLLRRVFRAPARARAPAATPA